MTVTILQEIVKCSHCEDKFYIYIEQDKFDIAYKVGIAQMLRENMVGNPLNEHYYETLPKAKRRFHDLKKQVIKGKW